MRKVIFLLLLLLSLHSTQLTFANTNSFISIVNPVRGNDFWNDNAQKVEDAVIGQVKILTQFNMQATWLFRFDVLENQKITNEISNTDEKGLFLEVTPSWAKAAGVSYHVSDSWHLAGSALLTGYEQTEREKLIDVSFDKFKKVFGSYPKSVGAWWIDSYSLSYMQKKYGITNGLIVADQYSTDNYQIWGQYFSTPYYPSKNNALHPAQTLENKLPIVITQWAARDPVNAYGNGVNESTFSVQANDYIDFHNLGTEYFSKLLDIYTNQPLNKFSHLVVGLENTYSWKKYSKEYENQINLLAKMRNSGKVSIVSLSKFSSWYENAFPELSPEQIIVASDPLGSNKRTVWFMNRYYRAGWFFNQDGSVFRDIRQYIDGDEELCFKIRCDSVNFATSATRVLDEVSFGNKWVIDQGEINNFKLSQAGDNFVITYENEAAKTRKLEFLPRDIGVDGKISSIDTSILEATKKDSNQLKNGKQLEMGAAQLSFINTILTLIKFLLFFVGVCLIPGFVLTRCKSFYASSVLGLVCLTLVFYMASLLKFKLLVPIYIFTNLLLFFRFRLFSEIRLQIPNFKNKYNLLFAGLILAGTIFQSLPTIKSSLVYPYGLGLWGPNTHDGMWHVALIKQLIKGLPSENPIFSGTILKNYHFFYDLLVAATNSLTGISILDLVFRLYPILFSLMLGIGSYYLFLQLSKQKIAAFISIYLIYFAGSFGWIVEYLHVKHLGGESAFWANQSISYNLNPPFAISLLIIIAILQILPKFKIQKNLIFTLTILCGTLLAFKAYGGILVIATLLIVVLIQRSWPYLILFLSSTIMSGLLFMSNFSIGSNLIVFLPFWFIHSMVDSPDRVGWIRLSLARTNGLEKGNWFKFFSAEIISLFLFIVGNLGMRVFALFILLKPKLIFQNTQLLFLFIFSSLSLLIPVLFIQAGNPWNTIQFIYYFLYICALVGGLIISKIITRLNKVVALIFFFVVAILTPINSWATANGYLSYQPHAKISQKELAGLQYLSSQTEGIVLTYPYDASLKKQIAEPWPLLAYDSTAYVAALSGKAVYIEDEPQNQILLTDYKKRLIASKDFFVSQDINFLQKNNIRYIYLPKIYNISLDQNKLKLKKAFENNEVNIYQVEK